MAGRSRNIDDWEAALIKAMLANGAYTKDQIISYFSRPHRTVNPYHVAEIKSGRLHGDVPAANDSQVEAYIRTHASPGEARQSFFEENPLHPVNLKSVFRVSADDKNKLDIGESDRFEFKERVHFGNNKEYARTIAAFSNARGGYLAFGVRDNDKALVGVPAGKINNYDPAKLNQFLSAHFAPVPVWEKCEHAIHGTVIGLVYVHASRHKPVICTSDAADVLREGDIYYRYPGETRRIRHAELAQLVEERLQRTEKLWLDIIGRVKRAGVENVGVFDTSTGQVSGPSGRFIIDEKLIPKLKFVAEGHFRNDLGAPTLRLIGDLEAVGAEPKAGMEPRTVKVHITDSDVLQDFLAKVAVAYPESYIQHLAHSQKRWLPIFYYMRVAGKSEGEAISMLREAKSPRGKHLDLLIARVKDLRSPPGAAKKESAARERNELLSKTTALPRSAEECKKITKAVRTLDKHELDVEYVLQMLAECEKVANEPAVMTAVQYAAAHVDVTWHKQIREVPEGSAPPDASSM